MKTKRLWVIILVPLLSVQAKAQTDTVVTDSVPESMNYIEEEAMEDSYDDFLQVRVKGFLDTYHAVRTSGKRDFMASRTRARGELRLKKGGAALLVSLNATYNGLLKERSGLNLREAYLSYEKGNLDLRIGRQIIVWGVADALCITDKVSPFDYSEFLAQDYDDIRIPVNALRAKYTWQSITFEALLNPVVNFFIIPIDKENPWALRFQNTPLPYTIDLESGKPEKRLKNMEYGGRITVNLRGIDLSISALRTWNKMPALCINLAEDGRSQQIAGKYNRMTMVGADCSFPISQMVVRCETAYYIGEAQGGIIQQEAPRRNSINTLLGVDWYPGSDWNISVQYSHKYTSGNMTGLSIHRNEGLATARISKEFLQNMLKISTFAYYDVTNRGIFNRLSASYALNDQVELTAGYDYFNAKKGKFAMYANNSESWVKVKYSF
ncbi:hypothetical protein QYZ87_06640 [Porphyromonadaceae bacterium W3.11]|nr:hypothetical protein [Porphyromonadaceae bacterium W3.11]